MKTWWCPSFSFSCSFGISYAFSYRGVVYVALASVLSSSAPAFSVEDSSTSSSSSSSPKSGLDDDTSISWLWTILRLFKGYSNSPLSFAVIKSPYPPSTESALLPSILSKII